MDEEEQAEERFLTKIEELGRFITHVGAGGDDEPSFSYTSGFTTSLSCPELIVFSLPIETNHQMLNDLYTRIRDGEGVEQGKPVDGCLVDVPVYFFKISDSMRDMHLTWTDWYMDGDPYDAWQLVWPTTSAVFPWQAEWPDSLSWDQPNLTGKSWADLQKKYDLPL